MDQSLWFTAHTFSNELKQAATACANLSSISWDAFEVCKEEIQIGECVQMKPELNDCTLLSVFSCLEPKFKSNS